MARIVNPRQRRLITVVIRGFTPLQGGRGAKNQRAAGQKTSVRGKKPGAGGQKTC